MNSADLQTPIFNLIRPLKLCLWPMFTWSLVIIFTQCVLLLFRRFGNILRAFGFKISCSSDPSKLFFSLTLHINELIACLFFLTKPRKARRDVKGSICSFLVNSDRYERELNRTDTVGNILSQMQARYSGAEQVEETSRSPKDGLDAAHLTWGGRV